MHSLKICLSCLREDQNDWVHYGLSILPETLLVQNVGVFHSTGALYPCWYLSVLLYGSLFLICLYRWLESIKATGLLVLIPLLVYCYLIRNYGKLECWEIIGTFYIPFWRGVADLTIGLLIHKITDKMKVIDSIPFALFHMLSLMSFIYIIIKIILHSYLS